MEKDEIGTITTLSASKETMTALIDQHRGRVVDTPGDNLLAEFVSVVDSVECAAQIQQKLAAINQNLPDDEKMWFRICINLGDVVEKNNRIFGDGVNIAARLEGMAEGGGICLSRSAYDQVKKKMDLEFEYLGEQNVKNITEPVEVYRVLLESDVRDKDITAQTKKKTFSLPEKPSIAVLPFDNMTADPNNEYIVDGITENIISALSKIGELFVIARNSVFTYKNKAIKVQQVSQDLGVRYVLEGSLFMSNDQVRITAQLVDAVSGYHLWSEQFNRTIRNLFDMMDGITQKIAVALQVELTHGEGSRAFLDTQNFEAWGCVVKGSSIFEQLTRKGNSKARKLFYEAAEIDPNYAMARVMIAWTYFIDVRFGYSEDLNGSIQKAIEIGAKAKALNNSLPEIHSLWNAIYFVQGQYEQAIDAGKKSIEMDPNNALSHILLAQTMLFSGHFEQAVELGEQAVRLSPYCPAWYLLLLAPAYMEAERYENALSVLERALERSKKNEIPAWWPYPPLIATYMRLRQEKEARFYSTELLKIDPRFSVDLFSIVIPYKDPALLNRYLNDLRNAGLK